MGSSCRSVGFLSAALAYQYLVLIILNCRRCSDRLLIRVTTLTRVPVCQQVLRRAIHHPSLLVVRQALLELLKLVSSIIQLLHECCLFLRAIVEALPNLRLQGFKMSVHVVNITAFQLCLLTLSNSRSSVDNRPHFLLE